MRAFMDKDFLLETETAKKLFHGYAENMPIIDYHCHISPKEIAQDIHFDTITQVWLGGDHYKWRLMRSNGVEEYYITGDAPDREKFQKWAESLEHAIGNPLYHWSHLELRRYFGYEGVLNGETAEEVWQLCNEKLRQPEMSARNLIIQSKVTHLCTTDDPADTLEWHKIIRDDQSFPVQVLPAWRPEAAMKIGSLDFVNYMKRPGNAAGVEINSFRTLKEALKLRLAFFEEMEQIFAKALNGKAISYEDGLKYKTAFLLFIGKEYKRLGWAMQLHYGVKRDNNQKLYRSFGPDAGVDCIDNHTPSAQLADLLNALDEEDALPKTILYSLNPIDNAAIGSIIGCFQNSECRAKIQQGSAWWFNDNKQGMIDQMTSLANLGVLGNFIGILTDSRSFISYPRHEYFRRILCNLIGGWVENGEYPEDEKRLGALVQDICYNNTKKYFEFQQ